MITHCLSNPDSALGRETLAQHRGHVEHAERDGQGIGVAVDNREQQRAEFCLNRQVAQRDLMAFCSASSRDIATTLLDLRNLPARNVSLDRHVGAQASNLLARLCSLNLEALRNRFGHGLAVLLERERNVVLDPFVPFRLCCDIHDGALLLRFWLVGFANYVSLWPRRLGV